MIPRFATSLLCLAALPFCLAGESAVPPAEAQNASTTSTSPAVRPLGLDEAIRLALSQSHLVRIQSFGVPIAKEGVTQAWGNFDPQLVASYRENDTESPLTPFSSGGGTRPFSTEETETGSLGLEGGTPWGLSYRLGVDSSTSRPYSLTLPEGTALFAGVSLTQPLLRDFGFSSGLADLRIARTDLRISEWEFQDALVGIVNQVIQSYAEVLFNQARLRSARRTLDMAQQLRNENERRRSLGSMSEYDVLSADARLANRQEAVISAEGALRTSENQLRALLSSDKTPALLEQRLDIVPIPAWAPTPGSVAADLGYALEHRPDYQRAKQQLRRTGLERARAFNQALPRVDLVASHGYNSLGSDLSGARTDLRNQDFRATSAGVNVRIPLGFAAERGRYRSAKLRQAQSAAYLEKLEQDILIEVGNAALRLETTRRQVESARRNRELNEQAMEAEQKLLKAGTGSTFAVLYQQEQLGYAEINEALAIADFTRASADYDRATGRTLSNRGIVPTDTLRTP